MKRLINTLIFPCQGIFGIGTIIIFMLIVAGCKKDQTEATVPKNYKELTIKMPSPFITLISGLGNQDTIQPLVIHSLNPTVAVDTSKYLYAWTDFTVVAGKAGFDTVSRKAFLTGTDFKQPGFRRMALAVTEKASGLGSQVEFSMMVSTPLLEGWALLSQGASTPVLGFCTYLGDQQYKVYKNVVQEIGLDTRLTGKALSITSGFSPAEIGGQTAEGELGIMTSTGIRYFNRANFSEYTAYNTAMSQAFPYKEGDVTFISNLGSGNTLMQENHRFNILYRNHTVYLTQMDRTILSGSRGLFYPFGESVKPILNDYNIFGGTLQNLNKEPKPFKASPLIMEGSSVGLIRGVRILYDMDNGVFVTTPGLSRLSSLASLTPLTVVLDNLKGYELLGVDSRAFSEVIGLTQCAAVLYNPDKADMQLYQFLSNGVKLRNVTIDVGARAGILASKHVAIDIRAGYILYENGNTVYGYDFLNGGTPVELLRLQGEEISVMKFQHIYFTSTTASSGRQDIYKDLATQLVVCSNKSGDSNTGGTFRLYRIPLGHQPAIKETELTGFAPIKDITFCPIP